MRSFPSLELEKRLWGEGYRYVAGLDEAGRGPWAGPVTAGAVVLPQSAECLDYVTDSKKMSEKRREEVFELIKSHALGWGVGVIEAEYIDKHGIQLAVKEAMREALKQAEDMFGERVSYVICDGQGVLLIEEYQMEKFNKGDSLYYSISAASILAKVVRDRIMREMASLFPEYGFESHVGYGTKAHQEALAKYGPTPIHRKSYKPVREVALKWGVQ